MVEVRDKRDLANRVLKLLRTLAPTLRKRGVTHAVLFGSVARGTHIPESDVDIALFIDDRADIGLFDIVEMERDMSARLGKPVHLTLMREDRRSPVRTAIDREGLPAF